MNDTEDENLDSEDADDEPDDQTEEDSEDYYDEDEDPGEMPTTRKTDFDAETLWALKESKAKLKRIQENAANQGFIFEEEIKEPKVKKKTVNKVGEVKISFDQEMLLDEIFAGLKLTSNTVAE